MIVDGSGLLGGITAYHLRMLCENPWSGGGGYTPEQVGRMTLDQIMFRLCDLDLLRARSSAPIELSAHATVQALKADDEGLYKGRAIDGSRIRAKIGGKSLARRLMEEEQHKKEAV
jgi:hypothetical protein